MEPIPWTKHPNPAAIKRNIVANQGSNSRIPLTLSASRNNDFEDSVNHPSNPVQERAKNIILGQMKIVGNSGKVRVARNQEVLQMPSSSSKELELEEKENLKVSDNQSQIANHHLQEKEPGKSVTFSNLPASAAPSQHSIFSFTTALQRSTYEFKPPAAAKYFLWDNTRIGPTMFSTTSDFIYSQVKITSPCLKALRMEILKAGLLSRANSIMSPPSIIGILMGKPSWSDDSCSWHLELDRFEAGEKASGAMLDDVLVHCAWSETPAKEGFNYIVLLERLKDQRRESPFFGLTTPFPIFAHFSTLEGGELTSPSFRMAIPTYSLEIYPIHEIRLVNTTLSHKLLSESSQTQPDYGLMSIDQARQLYLLSQSSSSIDSIPLIGVWVKSDYKSFRDGLLRKACFRYIENQRITKLDTGKSHLLVYFFNTANPSRPECFECVFSHDSERPFSLYGTCNNIPFELMSEDEPGFEFALNQVFDIPMKIPEVDVVDNAESVAIPSTEGQDLIEAPLVLPAAEESIPDLAPIQIETPAEPVDLAPAVSVHPPEISAPVENVAVSQSPISNEVISQQMMYINMLQQQIATLQSQMLNLTTGGPFMGGGAYGHHNPYWMHQPPHPVSGVQTQNSSQNPAPQATVPSTTTELKVTNPKESISTQVEMKPEEDNVKMQDEQVQVTFIVPQSQSIGTNTSFYFPAPSVQPPLRKMSTNQSIATSTEIKNEIETLPLLDMVSGRTHAPTDDGLNYQVFDPPGSERMEQAPLPDTSACDIIAGLVGDVEESFYHTGTEEGESSTATTPSAPIFEKSKPKVKAPFKRPVIAAEMQRKPLLLDIDESRESSLMLNYKCDTRDSSLRYEHDQTMDTEDQSLSFATLKYLQKYGLQ